MHAIIPVSPPCLSRWLWSSYTLRSGDQGCLRSTKPKETPEGLCLVHRHSKASFPSHSSTWEKVSVSSLPVAGYVELHLPGTKLPTSNPRT